MSEMTGSADTCAHCGCRIVERYAGTFVPRGGPVPTAWYHDRGEGKEFRWERACSWAEPAVVTSPATTTTASEDR